MLPAAVSAKTTGAGGAQEEGTDGCAFDIVSCLYRAPSSGGGDGTAFLRHLSESPCRKYAPVHDEHCRRCLRRAYGYVR